MFFKNMVSSKNVYKARHIINFFISRQKFKKKVPFSLFFYEKRYLCCYGIHIFYSVKEGNQNKEIFEMRLLYCLYLILIFIFQYDSNVKFFYICLFLQQSYKFM